MDSILRCYENYLKKKYNNFKHVEFWGDQDSFNFKKIMRGAKIVFIVIAIMAILFGHPLLKLIGIVLLIVQYRFRKSLMMLISDDKKFSERCEFVLRRIIESNKLYTLETVKGGEDYVRDSACLSFRFDESELCVVANAFGRSYAPKMKELAVYLESGLKLPVERVDNSEIGITKYFLSRRPFRRFNITNENVMERFNVNQGVIALDGRTNWNYDKNPHALITGVTGGGKSQFVKYLMLESYKQGAEVYIFDPKGEWKYFVNMDGFDPKNYASDSNQISAKLRELVDLMNQRYMTFTDSAKEYNYRAYGYKPVFVYFEELVATKTESDKKTQAEIMARLSALIVKARAAGIQIVLVTQSAKADVIDTNIRTQLGLKVALGNMGDTAFSMALGDYERLPSVSFDGVGVGYCRLLDGSPLPYRTPYLAKDLDYNRAVMNFVAKK